MYHMPQLSTTHAGERTVCASLRRHHYTRGPILFLVVLSTEQHAVLNISHQTRQHYGDQNHPNRRRWPFVGRGRRAGRSGRPTATRERVHVHAGTSADALLQC